MNLIGTALAGICVVVATRAASAAAEEPGDSQTGGEGITCEAGKTVNSAVSQPNTTVKVTCPDPSTLDEVLQGSTNNIYVDANCSKPGVLADVCPGAAVSTAKQNGVAASTARNKDTKKGTIVTLVFPQLPASQHAVCVKCSYNSESSNDCKAVITVAAAPPQGPQACAVGGTSITLEINKAGGSAQFACGNNLTLAPAERTEAYADDCSKVETLKDMTRSDKSTSGYVTVKAGKFKKKKLCYLCQPSVSNQQQKGGKDGPCKVYVQVSGSTEFAASVSYGVALACLAAMLRPT